MSKSQDDIFPDFVKMAEAFRVPAARVTHPSELRWAGGRWGGVVCVWGGGGGVPTGYTVMQLAAGINSLLRISLAPPAPLGLCRAAIRVMLDTPGPYLLDVMVPNIQHVLPMIPGGGSFKDIITTGDGNDVYSV